MNIYPSVSMLSRLSVFPFEMAGVCFALDITFDFCFLLWILYRINSDQVSFVNLFLLVFARKYILIGTHLLIIDTNWMTLFFFFF